VDSIPDLTGMASRCHVSVECGGLLSGIKWTGGRGSIGRQNDRKEWEATYWRAVDHV